MTRARTLLLTAALGPLDYRVPYGMEAGLELKSFTGATQAAGGYAVPRELDAMIETFLKASSPIRGVANVVKVGSAGYRKLVTTGGTPSLAARRSTAAVDCWTPATRALARSKRKPPECACRASSATWTSPPPLAR